MKALDTQVQKLDRDNIQNEAISKHMLGPTVLHYLSLEGIIWGIMRLKNLYVYRTVCSIFYSFKSLLIAYKLYVKCQECKQMGESLAALKQLLENSQKTYK